MNRDLGGIEIFYAMKANDELEILKVLRDLDSGFEVASLSELDKLKTLHIKSDRIMCMHPIKNPEFIKKLRDEGVSVLAADSKEELDKIFNLFPSAQVLLRLEVGNKGSDWPLTGKFGLKSSELLDLIKYSKKSGYRIYGITFHVGSQCRNLKNWELAIKASAEIFRKSSNLGMSLEMLSLGGGLPIKQTVEVPTIKEIDRVVKTSIKKYFNCKLRVSIEPGRGMVGDSGIMISTVVGKAERDGKNWLYIDAGVFNALMETVEAYRYELRTLSKLSKKKFNIGGPSCDSVDIVFRDIELPDVEIGDKIFILNSGAYTTVYASNFNGFDVPKVIYV